MESLLAGAQRLYDQINPYSSGNILTYYAWLVVYSATLVSAWRARQVWVRFVSFVANQVLQVGVIMSWSLTMLLAVKLWLPSLLIFVAVVATTYYVLREH